MVRILQCLIILTSLLYSCERKTPTRVYTTSFYHWKTKLSLDSAATNLLDSLQVKRLYVRYFDVTIASGVPTPVGQLEPQPPYPTQEIVPVIFLTNQVFKAENAAQIALLPKQIIEFIRQIHREMHNDEPLEIQFDCDWTESTKEAYFTFLKDVQAILPKETKLSATIRLHQYKFPDRTGVPPVARGVLMLYNTGDIDKWETNNSIFDASDCQKYIDRKVKYPLPLDVAIAAFHWGLVYREDELFKIINNLTKKELQDSQLFEPISNTRYRLKKATILSGHYLYPDDLIRMEKSGEAEIAAAKAIADGLSLADSCGLIYYHLDF